MKKFASIATSLILCLALVACSTNWVSQAIAAIKVLEPVTVSLLEFVGAETGHPIANSDVAKITTDLTNALTFAQDLKNATTSADTAGFVSKLQAALVVTQKDLDLILQTAGVSNSAKSAEIATAVDLVVGELNAIISLTNNNPTAAKKIPLTAKQLKTAFNAHMKATGNSKFVVK